MKILSCGKGDIKIQLGEEFNSVVIRAIGEMIMDYKGFCISKNSIKQIAPVERVLSADEKEAIAQQIANWDSKTMPLEFY